MKGETKVFRILLWQIVVAGAFSLGSLVTLGVLILGDRSAIAIAVCALVSAGALAAFAHAATTRIALEADGLEIVANFRRRFLPRESIETVVWERGSGVSVRLVGGDWLKLPETGHDSQVRANAIRAWLKRPAPGRARRRADR